MRGRIHRVGLLVAKAVRRLVPGRHGPEPEQATAEIVMEHSTLRDEVEACRRQSRKLLCECEELAQVLHAPPVV